ncbi:DUF2298 domain-containing protein [Archaeoglobus veneficus]|uniref:YYY membrane protein n=1 Tax=Archaeoglobus veneficus (strain DSM 11195 / SNP6) TaxID=693661 RepID=F2KPM8_ARCVS|nr:DUF2298 domain-containing protein [Archaeoglobus veneficus]AEA47556.1 YYY membrane protein [Archaeoglobus veneficus SNP6]
MLKTIKDCGYSVSKQFGIVTIVYITWILSSLRVLKFDFSVILALFSLLALSLLTLKRVKFSRGIILQEVLFVSTFFISLTYLMHKPEIYFAYSEDFMDFAFLKSILRSDYFPPQDPWFAGENLSYYFGHLIAAILIKISGVEAEAGYNLAVAAFFSIAVQSAFGIGYNLSGRKLHGLATAVLTCFTGFVSGLFQLLAYVTGTGIFNYKPFNGGLTDWLLLFDFSSATRIIPHTINFYPFFTFLQGDMHAHFTSIPFQLAFTGICLAIYQRFNVISFASALAFALFFIGINTWDFPAYLILLIATAYLATKNRMFLIPGVAITMAFLYSLLNGYIGFVDERTNAVDFLQIFAVFTFITLAYLAGIKLRMAVILLSITTIGFLLNFQLAFLLALIVLLLQNRKKEAEFPAILALTAMLLLIFCELFYIDDAYEEPYERMNTVMKVYMEVWLLWGVSSAFFLTRLRKAAKAISVILIAASLIHPFASAVSMPNKAFMGETEELTLNGMKWLEECKPEEYRAIRWLENKSGVVLEAPGEAYRYSSRVSTFTGLPTVIGWVSHEVMWGRGWDAVNESVRDVDSIYLNAPKDLVEKYKIRYIFVGEVEKKRYGKIRLDECEWLRKAYEDCGVVVYEVLEN